MTLEERLGGRAAIARGITEEFKALSRRPHGSGHEAATAGDLRARLEGLGLTVRRDGAGNLSADVPPAPGRAGAPGLILQGHMDMVCASARGFDPLAEAVTVVEAGGCLRSDGRSSLGADNMLGNAAVIWLLSTGRVAHGPLRLIFTVEEEIGLEGAKRVDGAWLDGSDYLLNTDGFKLGRAIVGSAGGRRETYSRPFKTVLNPHPAAFCVSLSGGAGGHSGDDIHLGRANAVKLLGCFLAQLADELDCGLAGLSGGAAHNAIPAGAQAVLTLPAGAEGALRRAAEGFSREVREAHAATDPGLTVALEAAPRPEAIWDRESRDGVLSLLCGLYDGVYAMHRAFPGVVGASANVGRVTAEGGEIQVWAFLRCEREEEERVLSALHDGAAARAGFTGAVSRYPGWPGDGDNPLARRLAEVYRAQTGRALEVSAVHVGLEPSVFREKRPGLVMASTGPDILDAHSVDERAPLAGLPDYALLLAGLMEAL